MVIHCCVFCILCEMCISRVGFLCLLKFIICLFVHLSYLIWLVLRETACGGGGGPSTESSSKVPIMVVKVPSRK